VTLVPPAAPGRSFSGFQVPAAPGPDPTGTDARGAGLPLARRPSGIVVARGLDAPVRSASPASLPLLHRRPRSGRVGRARGAGMATPWGTPRVPDVAMEGSSLGGATRARERIFRRESPSGLGPLHRRFIGCDVASAHRGRPKGVSRGPGMHQISGSILIRRLGSG